MLDLRRLSMGLKLSALLSERRKRAWMRQTLMSTKDLLTTGQAEVAFCQNRIARQDGEGHPTTKSTRITTKAEPPKHIVHDRMPNEASTRSPIPIPPRNPARGRREQMRVIPEGTIASDDGSQGPLMSCVARGFIFVESTPHTPNISTFSHGPIRTNLSTKRRNVEYEKPMNAYDDDVDREELRQWFCTLGVGSHGRLVTQEDSPWEG